MKIMKKVLALLLALAVLSVPMMVMAEESTEAALGTFDNMYQLGTTETLEITIAAESEAYVQVSDDNGSTVTVTSVSENYVIYYGKMNSYTPAIVDGVYTASFQTVSGGNYFCLTNNGTESAVFTLALEAGETVDVVTGTMDNPTVITFNEYNSAEYEVTLDAGNQGYYFSITAPADGKIAAGNLWAHDDMWNDVGWTYSIQNRTASVSGDYHFSNDEEVVSVDTVSVSAGDEVIVFVATYDPADTWNNPAGIISLSFNFYPLGSEENPEELELVVNPYSGAYGNFVTKSLAEGNSGYCYFVTAPAAGSIGVNLGFSVDSWRFNIYNETAEIYGDYYTNSDGVSEDSVAVNEGDIVKIVFATTDPEDPYWGTAPAGDVYVTVGFSALGSSSCPDEMNLGENSATIEAGDADGYTFSWTAPAAGELTVAMTDESGWFYCLNNLTGFIYGDQTAYVDGSATATIPVAKDDEVQLMVNTFNADDMWNNPAGTVNFTLKYKKPGDVDGNHSHDADDLAQLNKVLLGTTAIRANRPGAYDANNDGACNILDLINLKKSVAGLLLGQVNNPEELELMTNWMGNKYANAEVEMFKGDLGYYCTITSPGSGYFSIKLSGAQDAEGNNCGWMYAVNNETVFTSADEELTTYQEAYVWEGAEVSLWISTFDPDDIDYAPAGKVTFEINYYALGSMNNPEIINGTEELSTTLESGSQGYYYEFNATEAGTVTVTMNNGQWQYQVSKIVDDIESMSELYCYDDETVVSSESFEVVAGDKIKVWVNTWDSETPWSCPEGTIDWSFSFVGPLGSYSNPRELFIGGLTPSITIPVGETVFVKANEFNGTVVSASSETENGSYALTYGRMNYVPSVNGEASVTLAMFSGDVVGIINTSEVEIDVKVRLEQGTPIDTTGTMDDPEEIVAGSYSLDRETGDDAYFYKYTALAAGTVTIKMDEANESGWFYSYVVERANGTYTYSDNYFSSDDEPQAISEITVAEGDVITITMNSWDAASYGAAAGTVGWSLEFN